LPTFKDSTVTRRKGIGLFDVRPDSIPKGCKFFPVLYVNWLAGLWLDQDTVLKSRPAKVDAGLDQWAGPDEAF
jgi:hypothetical protein